MQGRYTELQQRFTEVGIIEEGGRVSDRVAMLPSIYINSTEVGISRPLSSRKNHLPVSINRLPVCSVKATKKRYMYFCFAQTTIELTAICRLDIASIFIYFFVFHFCDILVLYTGTEYCTWHNLHVQYTTTDVIKSSPHPNKKKNKKKRKLRLLTKQSTINGQHTHKKNGGATNNSLPCLVWTCPCLGYETPLAQRRKWMFYSTAWTKVAGRSTHCYSTSRCHLPHTTESNVPDIYGGVTLATLDIGLAHPGYRGYSLS